MNKKDLENCIQFEFELKPNLSKFEIINNIIRKALFSSWSIFRFAKVKDLIDLKNKYKKES
jgi:hypothetical protein